MTANSAKATTAFSGAMFGLLGGILGTILINLLLIHKDENEIIKELGKIDKSITSNIQHAKSIKELSEQNQLIIGKLTELAERLKQKELKDSPK